MEEVKYLQGQHRTLTIINQLPIEIEKSKERLREDFELNQAMRKEQDNEA